MSRDVQRKGNAWGRTDDEDGKHSLAETVSVSLAAQVTPCTMWGTHDDDRKPPVAMAHCEKKPCVSRER